MPAWVNLEYVRVCRGERLFWCRHPPVPRHILQNLLKEHIVVFEGKALTVDVNDPYLGVLLSVCGEEIAYELVEHTGHLPTTDSAKAKAP